MSLAQTKVVDFQPIMRHWEKLRLFYNAALVAYVLLVSFIGLPGHSLQIDYWFMICICGVAANLCFFAAPALEAYATCFGLWNQAMTMLLFLAGLGFTALLATGCMVSYPNI